MKKHILITICGRAGSKGFRNKNLKTFCGKPLVYYTLSAVELLKEQRPDWDIDVCLNTDSEDLAHLVAEKYPEVAYLPRGEKLGGDTVPKMDVFHDCLDRMEAKKGIKYDYLVDTDITSPLRKVDDIAKAIDVKDTRSDVDLVFSVTEARRNPYFNQVRAVGNPAADGHVEKVVESPYTARQQAPAVYDLNASIYVFKRDFLANNTTGILWDGVCSIYEMQDTGVLDIDSEDDYLLMEAIATHLYQKQEEFGKVRDNIR